MTEEWRPVVGWEGLYDVSSDGNVRSLDRQVLRRDGSAYLHKGRVLRPTLTNRGYPSVGLQAKGISKFVTVHRVVAVAFVPNPRGLEEINHIDGDKQNSRAGNLEWCSRQENCRHATQMRLNPVPKLTDEQVREVLARAKTERNWTAIARAVGTSRDTVSGILARGYYSWVQRSDVVSGGAQ